MVQDTVWQICDRLHGSLTPKRSLFFLQREVKRLALLDMPFAQSDVCFRGNNGSRAHIVKSTRLTPSGPRHRYRVYNIVRSQFNFLPESCLKNGDVPKYWHLVPSVGTKSFLTLMWIWDAEATGTRSLPITQSQPSNCSRLRVLS
jgi:hypothetical protein